MEKNTFQIIENHKVIKEVSIDFYDFIPIISIDLGKLKKEQKNNIWTGKGFKIYKHESETIELSNSLDNPIQELFIVEFEKDVKKIEVHFKISQGNSKATDYEGKLRILTENTTSKYDKVQNVNYGSVLPVIIHSKYLSKDPKNPSFLIFKADDDGEGFDIKGKQNILCGRVKVVTAKKTCICKDSDWTLLPNMVSESKKVAYGKVKINWAKNPVCYHYALQELRNAGYWVKSEHWNKKWDGTKEMNDHIFQLLLHDDVAGMKKGVQSQMFKDALIYLKKAMKNKTPVLVGLDYDPDHANDDLITDHFGVITGCGKDEDGKLYFYVTDNANPSQKFICNCEAQEIKSKDGLYTITQVRKSKKL